MRALALLLALAQTSAPQADHAAQPGSKPALAPLVHTPPQPHAGKSASPQSSAAPSSASTAPSTTSSAPATTDAPAAPTIEPYAKDLRAGFEEIESHARAGAVEDAVHVADALLAPTALARWRADWDARGGWRQSLARAATPLVDASGFGGPPPAIRAEIQYAKGVALELAATEAEPATAPADPAARAALRSRSDAALERAFLDAGPGELRLVAAYERGSVALAEGEEERAKIPEVSGRQAPPAPPSAAPGASANAAQSDPLQLARAAYVRARDRFVERLTIDPADDDTRANVELVQRRLHQLDDIEKKRKQDEQQKKDQQDKDKKDQQKDEKGDQQQKKDDQKQDQDKQDQQKKDGQDQPKPGEDKKDEPKQDQPKPDEKKQDEQKPGEEKKDEKQPNATKPAEEQKLSKEEMVQLLERLQQIEEQNKALQEQLRQMRRVKVKKDW